MEFWNDIATDKSWKVLIGLKKEFDFILIGGWACYLLTKKLKSKDVDIVVDFETLEKIKNRYPLKKADFLKKYEAKIEGVSIDVYVPFYSKFLIPIEKINKNIMVVEGFKIPKPEVLLILKQQAELERKGSVKGQKDRTDIINLLINSDFDVKNYIIFLKKYKLQNYTERLKEIVQSARKEFEYLGIIDPRKQKLKKREILEKLKVHERIKNLNQ